MIQRGRQPTCLPLAFDPSMIEAVDDRLREAYLEHGPVGRPKRNDDGSGSMFVHLTDRDVEVQIPADTLWIEIRNDWSADDEDAISDAIGPGDVLGEMVQTELHIGEDLRALMREQVRAELADWEQAHKIEIHVPVEVGDNEADVRREAASTDLAARLLNFVDVPSIVARLRMARRQIEAVEHPLRGEVLDILNQLELVTPRDETQLDEEERAALRRKRKRDRAYRAAQASRGLLRFIGGDWDGASLEEFLGEAPVQVGAMIVNEIMTHVHRVSALAPKRRRASSRPSG